VQNKSILFDFPYISLQEMKHTPAYNLVAIIGPTATGKTSLAANLAFHIGGEVISADSRQVYRRMDLGTGKDYAEYIVNEKNIPVHLIDHVEPGYKYSVFEYQHDFNRAFADLQNRGKMPVLCGGSGMYIDAALRSYKLIEVPRNEALRSLLSDKSPEELHQLLSSLKTLHNSTDLDSPERTLRAIEIATYYRESQQVNDSPHINPLVIGIMFVRETDRLRITERLQYRLKQGMIEEVKKLMESGITAETLLYYGLEYRFITRYLAGELDYNSMFSQLNTAIHQYAKRQRTWFRKMEREGTTIHWISGELPLEKKLDVILQHLESGRG
jgi:tRNA dimethylallyltransferase